MAKRRKHYSGKELLEYRRKEREKHEEELKKNKLERMMKEENFIKINYGYPIFAPSKIKGII